MKLFFKIIFNSTKQNLYNNHTIKSSIKILKKNNFKQILEELFVDLIFCAGGMSERFNEAVLKTVDCHRSGVRIPLPPPNYNSNEIKSPQTQCLRAFLFFETAQNVHLSS